MTKFEIQKKQLHLIQEFDDACRDLKVPYVLLGRTAYLAEKHGAYTRGSYDFDVVVLANNTDALVDMLSTGTNRAIEVRALKNGANRECYRYVDTETTLYDRRDLEQYARQNIGINIVPAFKSKDAAIYGVSAISRTPLDNGFRRLFHRLQSLLSLGEYFVYNDQNEIVGINSNTVFVKKSVSFEGLVLPVPSNMEAHMKDCYGSDWKRVVKDPLRSVNSINVIHLPDISYEEFVESLLSDGINFEKYTNDLSDYWKWKRSTHDPLMAKSKQAFQAGNLSVDRIDLFLDYQETILEMRIAYQDNDIDNLERLMMPYLEKTARYKEYNLGFYINEELFGYAKLIWHKQGKAEFANEVEKLIPDYYKNCNLENYLADYIK